MKRFSDKPQPGESVEEFLARGGEIKKLEQTKPLSKTRRKINNMFWGVKGKQGNGFGRGT